MEQKPQKAKWIFFVSIGIGIFIFLMAKDYLWPLIFN